MGLTKDLETVLTPEILKSFSRLFKTEKDYCRIMGDLCTIREYLSNYIAFEDSPLHGQTEHPIFKIACSINDIIGSLLKIDYHLYTLNTKFGKVISCYNPNN